MCVSMSPPWTAVAVVLSSNEVPQTNHDAREADVLNATHVAQRLQLRLQLQQIHTQFTEYCNHPAKQWTIIVLVLTVAI